MVQRGERLGLAVKTRALIRVLADVIGQKLDRDVTLERRVARLPDHTHTALADLVDDAVMEQFLSWLERQAAILPLEFYPGIGWGERVIRLAARNASRPPSSAGRRHGGPLDRRGWPGGNATATGNRSRCTR